jgi:uncharacterized membrane protein YcjF (UPF0283 family)
MIATLVEGQQLLETVAASIVAGVGVTFAFSVSIWGVGRFTDLRRNEKPVAAAAAAAVGILALAVVVAAVVAGIVAMTSK